MTASSVKLSEGITSMDATAAVWGAAPRVRLWVLRVRVLVLQGQLWVLVLQKGNQTLIDTPPTTEDQLISPR